MATSLLGLFLSSSFSASYFVFKVTQLCFFVWPFWTQYTSDFFSPINLQNNLTIVERLKNIPIRKFERDISNLLTVTSSKIKEEGKNEFFKSKFELHDKKLSRGSNNLFDLNDFSNYGSSNYMNSTVLQIWTKVLSLGKETIGTRLGSIKWLACILQTGL